MASIEETEEERTQELTLLWSTGKASGLKEIVRRQWNFSPDGSTTEMEDYTVDLKNVISLELVVDPYLATRKAVATLADLRIA
jgi:hypothetical protein